MHTCSCAPNPVIEDPDQIWIYVRYGPNRWRFKNWPMKWSGDSYWFVQWRPESDSVPKLRHFIWVFVYWSILISAFYLNISCICIYYSVLLCSCQSLLLHGDTLILFYWYIITLLPIVLSIRSIILGRWVLILILLVSNNQMRILIVKIEK